MLEDLDEDKLEAKLELHEPLSEEQKERIMEDKESLEINQNIEEFISKYIKNYLDNVTQSSIEEMIVEDYAAALLNIAQAKDSTEELPKWFGLHFAKQTEVITMETKVGKVSSAMFKTYEEMKEE